MLPTSNTRKKENISGVEATECLRPTKICRLELEEKEHNSTLDAQQGRQSEPSQEYEDIELNGQKLRVVRDDKVRACHFQVIDQFKDCPSCLDGVSKLQQLLIKQGLFVFEERDVDKWIKKLDALFDDEEISRDRDVLNSEIMDHHSLIPESKEPLVDAIIGFWPKGYTTLSTRTPLEPSTVTTANCESTDVTEITDSSVPTKIVDVQVPESAKTSEDGISGSDGESLNQAGNSQSDRFDDVKVNGHTLRSIKDAKLRACHFKVIDEFKDCQRCMKLLCRFQQLLITQGLFSFEEPDDDEWVKKFNAVRGKLISKEKIKGRLEWNFLSAPYDIYLLLLENAAIK